jgi:3-hydroxyisobutyrate dehydrogenase
MPTPNDATTTDSARPPVALLGLGLMGRPMALNLLRAGYPLTVYNRTRAKAETLAAEGATVAGTPREAAQAVEFAIVCVSDSPDVVEVVAGPEGLLQGSRPGLTIIDMSTISPEVTRTLAAQAAERGAAFVDAPVSGGTMGAEKGTLSIMAGGEAEAVERCRPIFEVLGSRLVHCGSSGAGQTVKLCNQVLVAGNLLALAECLVFARKAGVDPATMIEAVESGAAGSWTVSNLGPRLLRRDLEPGFMVETALKDMRLVMETADANGVPLPGTALAQQLWRSCAALGLGRKGTQAMLVALEQLAGLADNDS